MSYEFVDSNTINQTIQLSVKDLKEKRSYLQNQLDSLNQDLINATNDYNQRILNLQNKINEIDNILKVVENK